MKADDFFLPLPPNSRVQTATITGGALDCADGLIEIQFNGTYGMSPKQYYNWLTGRLQRGTNLTVAPIPRGLAIKFHYFGDQ